LERNACSTEEGVHRYAHLLSFRIDNQAHNLLLPTNYVLVPLLSNRRFLPRSLSIDNSFNNHDVQRRVVFERQGITGTTTTMPNKIRDDRGYTIPRRERSVIAPILLLKSLSMSETSATRTVRKEDVERNTVGYTIEHRDPICPSPRGVDGERCDNHEVTQ
jgi:hypothetical protein